MRESLHGKYANLSGLGFLFQGLECGDFFKKVKIVV